MTKIDIISGFLGAGKTTLIKKLLSEAFKGEQVVLIENEFGEIAVDGGFLKESGIEIREMNSGCICCSLVGDFGESLHEVMNTYHPDRILIEPSGVGKLSDVIKAVQNVVEETEGMVLNSYTTMVDAKKAKMYIRNFGEFFNNQVQYAGTIILSRTDILDEEKVMAALALVREINPKATVITTPIAELEGSTILSAIENPVSFEQETLDAEVAAHEHEHHHHHDHEEEEEHEHHHHHDHDEDEEEEHEHHHHGHHHHHADEIFTSWGRETVKKFTREEIEKCLNALADSEKYGDVLRAKGMLPAPDGSWTFFDMVPEEVELRNGTPEVIGRVCVIGAHLKEDALAELFAL